MSKEKQIKEMTNDLIFTSNYGTKDAVANYLIGKGWSKQSEVIKEFVERLHTELRVYGVDDKFNKGKFLTVVDDVANKMKGGAK